VHVASYCRQINGCDSNVSEALVGDKGKWKSGQGLNTRATLKRGQKPAKKFVGPYVQEHKDLIDSIVHGKKLNEAQNVAISTMTAIMGRMAAYSGAPVTWDEAYNSDVRLGPDSVALEMKLPEAKPRIAGRA
jgi:myo-inositol 2-dehydrogenase / D-chiro-inositol 1-dehydrogenase